jgi:hypothetical protein
VHIGTLSKAVGAHGGFVACRADMKVLLLNKGRPYIYSTAAPAPVLAAAIAALQVNEKVRYPERHMHLKLFKVNTLRCCWNGCLLLPHCEMTHWDFVVQGSASGVPYAPPHIFVAIAARAALPLQEPERRGHLWKLVKRLGEGLGVEAQSPIVPVVLGSETAAVTASAALLQLGFYVPAIRPPTVAHGSSRYTELPTLQACKADVGQALVRFGVNRNSLKCPVRFIGVGKCLRVHSSVSKLWAVLWKILDSEIAEGLSHDCAGFASACLQHTRRRMWMLSLMPCINVDW